MFQQAVLVSAPQNDTAPPPKKKKKAPGSRRNACFAKCGSGNTSRNHSLGLARAYGALADTLERSILSKCLRICVRAAEDNRVLNGTGHIYKLNNLARAGIHQKGNPGLTPSLKPHLRHAARSMASHHGSSEETNPTPCPRKNKFGRPLAAADGIPARIQGVLM